MSATLCESPSVAEEIANGDVLLLVVVTREQFISPSAGTRWVLDGLPGPLGIRVKLQAIKRGKKWVTSRAALARFFSAIQADAPLPAYTPRSASKRDQAAERAERSLSERYGI